MIEKELTLYEYFKPIRNNPNNTNQLLIESVEVKNIDKTVIVFKTQLKKLGVDITPFETEVKNKCIIITKELKNKKASDIDKKSFSKRIILLTDSSIKKFSTLLNDKIDNELVKGALIAGIFILIKVALEALFGFFLGPWGTTVVNLLLKPFMDGIFNMIAADTNSTTSYFIIKNALSIKDIFKHVSDFKKTKDYINAANAIIKLSNTLNSYQDIENSKIGRSEKSESRTGRILSIKFLEAILNGFTLAFSTLFYKFMLKPKTKIN